MKTNIKDAIVKLERGEFYTQVADDELSVLGTVKGYRKLAHYCGIKLLTPPRLTFNGEDRSNPHVISTNGHIEVVSRKIAFGFDYNGEPVAVDQTIIFSPINYLAKKLIELAKKYPGIAEIKNMASIKPADLKQGMFISMIDSGVTNIGVWVKNLGHPELENVWSEYHESVLYSERSAQTICERTALKKHSAIPAFTQSMLSDDGSQLNVPIKFWKLNAEESSNLSEMASKIELGKEVDVKRTISIGDGKEEK